VSERRHPEPGPRDDTDALQDIARDLAEVASQLSTFKFEANAYLSDPNYDALKHRLEMAHAGVEAATVVLLALFTNVLEEVLSDLPLRPFLGSSAERATIRYPPHHKLGTFDNVVAYRSASSSSL